MGCSIACCAMMCECSYQEAKAYFLERNPEAGIKAVAGYDVHQFLIAYGWIYTKYANKYRWNLEGSPDIWPCEPLEAVNLCSVQAGPNPDLGHSVILLQDGSVLDPLHPEIQRLDVYQYVNSISGWKREDTHAESDRSIP